MATPQKTAKNKADALFSSLIRAHGTCERCGKSGRLETSHWLSRRFSNIRTDFDNAFCLCSACHRWWHNDPTAATDWAIEKRGRETYERLREAANEKSKIWWPDELKRLQEIAKESA
jgi:hypothetical protein